MAQKEKQDAVDGDGWKEFKNIKEVEKYCNEIFEAIFKSANENVKFNSIEWIVKKYFDKNFTIIMNDRVINGIESYIKFHNEMVSSTKHVDQNEFLILKWNKKSFVVTNNTTIQFINGKSISINPIITIIVNDDKKLLYWIVQDNQWHQDVDKIMQKIITKSML